MNHSFQIKLIVVPLLLLYADFLSAQERDLFKQLIKESIKADLKEQLMQSDAISIDTFYGSFHPP
ncbi:MAG: hypothetical protein LIO93_10195 [Bacteroidales bacterium]|nr:hypothetical protein [Bacteroidales bacterium]